jgi:hypothetical protein
MRRGFLRVPARSMAILVLVLIPAAFAASGSAAPQQTPDLAQMALAVSDLPAGAKVKRQRYVRDADFVASYMREFKPGVRIGKSRVDLLESDIGLMESPDEAASYFTALAALFKTKKGRAFLTRQILQEVPKEVPKGVFTVSFGRVRSLGVGESSLVAPITFSFLQVVRLPFVFAFVRTDKVIASLQLGGFMNGTIATSDVARLARSVAGRVEQGLVPANSSPPTVSGTPQSGATLAVATGIWTHDPSSFAYRWLRCDASGANCQPIEAATVQTYVVTDADVGSTLRAEATAFNGPARSQPALSAQTQVVTPAGGPAPAPGTTAQIQRVAVCPAADVAQLAGGAFECKTDWSTRTMPAGGRIYCTVRIADGVGARISLAYLSGTSIVWQGGDEITESPWLQWLWYGPFSIGSYSCSVSINGNVVAALPFAVGA